MISGPVTDLRSRSISCKPIRRSTSCLAFKSFVLKRAPIYQPGRAPGGCRRPVTPPQTKPRSIPPTMMARRSAFERNGFFSTEMEWSDDADWLLRARDNGLRIAPLDHLLLIRRIHGGNLTYDTSALARGAALALKARIDRKRSRA